MIYPCDAKLNLLFFLKKQTNKKRQHLKNIHATVIYRDDSGQHPKNNNKQKNYKIKHMYYIGKECEMSLCVPQKWKKAFRFEPHDGE